MCAIRRRERSGRLTARDSVAGPTARAQKKVETIYGVHAVEEALSAGEPMHAIVTTRERARHPALRRLLAQAEAKRIRITFENDRWFAQRSAHHQHVAAIVDAFSYSSWAEVVRRVASAQEIVVVALDHIEDPQNVGAIVRNAEGAGAGVIVIPDRRSAMVTPAARRAAAGAASHVMVAAVPNLVRALDELKGAGCWVTGLATGSEAPYSETDLTGKRVFVVGAEGKGLHRLVSEHCDNLVRIPLLGKVSSLNVASAAAIVLFEAVRQRHFGAPRQRPNNAQRPAKP